MRRHQEDDDQQLAALAHELSNALAVIGGHAQLIERRITNGAPLDPLLIAKQMAIISTAVVQSARLIALLRDGSWHQAPPPTGPPDGNTPPPDRPAHRA